MPAFSSSFYRSIPTANIVAKYSSIIICDVTFRGVIRIPATSKMELFVTQVNGFQSFINAIKNSTSDVAVVLHLPLDM